MMENRCVCLGFTSFTQCLFLLYFIRIIIVVTIAAIFSNKISYLLAFLMGFIINYIGLLVATIKGQRGSE